MKRFINLSIIVLNFLLSPSLMAAALDPAKEQIIHTYMRYLDEGKYDEINKLFIPNGTVDSPRTGKVSFAEFHKVIKDERYKVTLKNIYASIKDDSVVAYIEIVRRDQPNAVPKKSVDIYEFAPNSNKIKALTIIFNNDNYTLK